MLDLFPLFFSSCNSFYLFQISLGVEDNHFVFNSVGVWTFPFEKSFALRDPAMTAGDLAGLIGEFCLLLLLSKAFFNQSSVLLTTQNLLSYALIQNF